MTRLTVVRIRSVSVVTGALVLAVIVLGATSVVAQGARQGGPPPPPPTQGFESNTQIPANYTPQEAAAAALVETWVNRTAAHDLDGAMAVIDNNILSRPDAVFQMASGPTTHCAAYFFTRMPASFVRLEDLYVVGGPLDTLVLFKRADINAPAGRGGLGGFTVQVGALVRVKSGRITEWLDAPISRLGGLGSATDGPIRELGTAIGLGANAPEACKKYPVAGLAPPPAQLRPAEQILTYGTSTPERYWSVDEAQAAQAIRAWFAARQAGDPLLLGAFVHQNVIFRADGGAARLEKGRANLLRVVCGTFSGQQRLTELYPLGTDFDTLVLTESVNSQGTRTAGFFRVQKGLITEWQDVVVEAAGPAAAANPNSAACQAVNAALPPA